MLYIFADADAGVPILPKSSSLVTEDVYTESYQRTIFRMDPFTRAHLPLMTDEKFMDYLQHDKEVDNSE